MPDVPSWAIVVSYVMTHEWALILALAFVLWCIVEELTKRSRSGDE